MFLERQNETPETSFDCIRCGGAVEASLASLGSTTCLDCRDQADPRPALSDGNGVPAFAFAAELLREIDRSRRYNRPFALIGVRAVEQLEPLRASVRSIDRVWADDGCVFVLLPESNREVAEGLIERLAGADVMPVGLARVAVFPDDALTTNALLSLARKNGDGQAARLNGHSSAPRQTTNGVGRLAAFRRSAFSSGDAAVSQRAE